MIRAVVFDFDGVVLESADVKTDAFVELFAPHGADVATQVKAYHLANLGISRFKKFAWIHEHLLGRVLTDDESRALGEQFSALAFDKVLAAPFVPGAVAALAALAATHPLFVASGTPDDELQQIVDRRGLRGYFREVHGTPAEKPEIVRGLMQRHGHAAAELLFIGDGASDHKAAAATGVEFLARDTPALHDHWTSLGVRRVPDLTGLAEIVSRW